MSLGSKIGRGLRRVLSSQPADPRVAPLRRALLDDADTAGQARLNGPVVAVQGVEDPLFYGLFAALMIDLRRCLPVEGRLLLVRSINGAIGTGALAAIARSLPLNWLLTAQWARANRALVGRVAYRSHSLAHPLADLADWRRARALWRSLQSSDDIAGLEIDGVLVGDLVIDTYLRFRPSPSFRVADPFVCRILWQTLRDLRRARAFFDTVRPALYLSSYSTYVEHGVAVRVALGAGVPVHVYGNLTTFGKRLTPADVYHTPDYSAYRAGFAQLDDQEACLAQADRQLSFRLAGGIDTATSYMKVSAYAGAGVQAPDVAGAVVVFLHDFYDSPHVYADLVFPDFWAWITFTIDTLAAAGIPFWIKPHPNQIALSQGALEELQLARPGLRILPKGITNTQLVEGGMACGVTAYGTVAHELAYLGVPTIGCARHPHHSFAFCRTARDRDEYAAFLRTPAASPLARDEMRRQALAFYYMHNLHGAAHTLALRSAFVQLWKASNAADAAPASVRDGLQALRALPAWHAHIQQLAMEISHHDR